MEFERLMSGLAWFWRAYGYQVVIAALVATAVVLAIALVWAVRRGRPDRWVAHVAGFAVLALSAEGMWVVAREQLRLPAVLAASVFFVAEAAMVSSALQATRHYQRTTVRDEGGNVVRPGSPGKHGRAVWVIAAAAGVIVALNSKSIVEFPLRLALPLAAAYLWWNALTVDGAGTPETSTWRWTPRRLLLWLGAIEPGERDMVEINRERLVAAMTVTAHRLHADGWFQWWNAARLRRLARDADDAIVVEVRRRVSRVYQIAELTAPGADQDGSAVRTDDADGRLVRSAGRPHSSVRTAPVRQLGRSGRTTRTRRTVRTAGRTDEADLLRLGREIAVELTSEGVPLSRDRLVKGVRARGVSLANDRASALYAALRSEPGGTDVAPTTDVSRTATLEPVNGHQAASSAEAGE